LHVWEVESLTEVEKPGVEAGMATTPLHVSKSILMAVVFTPDGKSLIAADHSGVVRIWNTATWSLEKTLEFPRLTAMDIPSDGSLLALGFGTWIDRDPGIILWDLKAGTHRRTLLGHRPFAVAFAPGGKTLASTSERHDVLLWDVATGMQLRKLEGHETTVGGADFSSDGTKLATTDFYGGLQIWEAATLVQIDRHPLTLRALFRLGVTQNLERRYAAAEATLRRLLSLQERTLSDDAAEISKTRAELEVAIEGQRKQSERPPPKEGVP
jgi:WD40 repeat protein